MASLLLCIDDLIWDTQNMVEYCIVCGRHYIYHNIYLFEESERDWERSRDIKIMSTKESLREREMER